MRYRLRRPSSRPRLDSPGGASGGCVAQSARPWAADATSRWALGPRHPARPEPCRSTGHSWVPVKVPYTDDHRCVGRSRGARTNVEGAMSAAKRRPGWDTGDWTGLPPVQLWPYRSAVACPVRAGQRHDRCGARRSQGGDRAHRQHHRAGLAARRGIDILIGLREPAATAACVERLERLGYARTTSLRLSGYTSPAAATSSTSRRSGASAGSVTCSFGITCARTRRRRLTTSASNATWSRRTARTGSATSPARRPSSRPSWSALGAPERTQARCGETALPAKGGRRLKAAELGPTRGQAVGALEQTPSAAMAHTTVDPGARHRGGLRRSARPALRPSTGGQDVTCVTKAPQLAASVRQFA